MSVALKAAAWAGRFKETKNDSPVLGTILDFQRVRFCDSPVHRTPGSHFKMLITQPRSKKNQNGPRTSLMGPGGAVWGKKPSTKNLVRLSL